jgi:hypothetical protein
VSRLVNAQRLSLLIIDACRAEANPDGLQPFDPQVAGLSAGHLSFDSELHILYGSTLGHYSYEASAYSASDFVPELALWPASIDSKGGGLFSLGMLASLVCEDALEGDRDFTLQNTGNFLRRYFFSEANKRWPDIETALKKQLVAQNLTYLAPDADYVMVGTTKNAVLRKGTDKAPRCFAPRSQ